MKKYKTIKEVWTDVDLGVVIHWETKAYKIYVEKARGEYQENHFSNRDGEVLSVRCIENYFGSLLDLNEIQNLFSEET